MLNNHLMGRRRTIWPGKPYARQSGVALVELTIILPVMLLMSFATLEFALAISAYRQLDEQVRAATRYLAWHAPGELRDEAICLVRTGIASAAPCAGSLILPGLASATVTVEDAANSPTTHLAVSTSAGSSQALKVNLVTVTVSGYRHALILGSLTRTMTGSNSSITFSSVSCTMRQTL